MSTISFPPSIHPILASNKTPHVQKYNKLLEKYSLPLLFIQSSSNCFFRCRNYFAGTLFLLRPLMFQLHFSSLPDRKRSSLALAERDFCCLETALVACEEPGTLLSACRDGSTPERQFYFSTKSVLQIKYLLPMLSLFHHLCHELQMEENIKAIADSKTPE